MVFTLLREYGAHAIGGCICLKEEWFLEVLTQTLFFLSSLDLSVFLGVRVLRRHHVCYETFFPFYGLIQTPGPR